jgi:hypothetical protein
MIISLWQQVAWKLSLKKEYLWSYVKAFDGRRNIFLTHKGLVVPGVRWRGQKWYCSSTTT